MRGTFIFRSKKEAVSLQVERRAVLVIAVLVLLVLLAAVLGTSLGSDVISPLEVLRTILGLNAGEYDFVVLTLRLPRVLLSLLVGAALGMSGAILQGVIRNPLASPDVIGITGGAAAVAVGFVTLLGGAVSIKLLPAFAVAGALVTSMVIYALAWKAGVAPIRLVLIGVGISAITSAGTTFMLIISPFYTAGQAYIWLTGSVYGASWTDVYTIIPVILLVVPLALWLARSLNAQEFGDDLATGLGVTVERHRFALLLCSVLLAGFAVAVAGTLGFAGLIAPHIARKLAGRMFGGLLLVSALTGALLVFGADLVGRTAFLPLDVPAGVFTAGIGAPFFLYLLFKNRNQFNCVQKSGWLFEQPHEEGGETVSILEAKDLTISYGTEPVIDNLNLAIPKGKITVLIGSNGCGKSTLLRTIARLLRPRSGTVLLNGEEIAKLPAKEVSRRMAILPQGPSAPEGLTVSQLVRQGRYPHQSWLKQWSREDERMVRLALESTRLSELADRPVDALSGGQRQRAWIAMTLAQGTETLLLDEPTTYLDMSHQIEVLDLLFELNEREGRTIVMVLHDLNLACRYAHHIVAVHNKTVFAQGRPEDIVTREMVRTVFRMDCEIAVDPLFGTPLCIPHGRGRKIQDEQDYRQLAATGRI